MSANKLSEDDMDTPVEIVVTSRNVDVSEHFRLHITQRLVRLERYDSNMIRYDVELDHENNPRQSKASQRVAILGHGKWNVPDFIDTGLGCQFGEFPES